MRTVVLARVGEPQAVDDAQVLTGGKHSCGACHSETPTGTPLANRLRWPLYRSAQDFLFSHGTSRSVATHSIGVTVIPADATLRAQLGLPAEKGLVVTNVDPNSSALEAGIAQHDLLLSLDDKPLASPDDLNKQVDAVGDKPAGRMDVIRNGKRMKSLVSLANGTIAASVRVV